MPEPLQLQSRGSSFPCAVPTWVLWASPPALPTPGLSLTARGQQMGSGFLYSVDTSHGVYGGHHSRTSALRTTAMATAALFYSQKPLKLAAGPKEQKEQIPSPPCSGDISCTRLQLTWCVPCSFPAHLSAVKQMPSAAEGAGSLQSNIWGRAAQGKVRTCRQFFIISSSVLN